MESQPSPLQRAAPRVSFLRALAECVCGGVLIALAFASSLEGFNPAILRRPAVIPIAFMGGVAGGVLVSPAVYFLLRHVRPPVRIAVCVATVLGTVALTLTSPHLGLFSGFILLFLFAFLAFLLRHYSHAPHSDTLGASDAFPENESR